MTLARNMWGPQPEARGRPLFHRVFRAEHMAVRRTLDDMRTCFVRGLDEDTAGRLELVLAEVLNNIVEHGADPATGPQVVPFIHMSLIRHAGGLACTISDDGVTLPGHCLRPRILPQDRVVDELPEGGFGWYLIQDLTQSICYFREGRRNFLAFTLTCSDPQPV